MIPNLIFIGVICSWRNYLIFCKSDICLWRLGARCPTHFLKIYINWQVGNYFLFTQPSIDQDLVILWMLTKTLRIIAAFLHSRISSFQLYIKFSKERLLFLLLDNIPHIDIPMPIKVNLYFAMSCGSTACCCQRICASISWESVNWRRLLHFFLASFFIVCKKKLEFNIAACCWKPVCQLQSVVKHLTQRSLVFEQLTNFVQKKVVAYAQSHVTTFSDVPIWDCW